MISNSNYLRLYDWLKMNKGYFTHNTWSWIQLKPNDCCQVVSIDNAWVKLKFREKLCYVYYPIPAEVITDEEEIALLILGNL